MMSQAENRDFQNRKHVWVLVIMFSKEMNEKSFNFFWYTGKLEQKDCKTVAKFTDMRSINKLWKKK
jgi:hypothetical protein